MDQEEEEGSVGGGRRGRKDMVEEIGERGRRGRSDIGRRGGEAWMEGEGGRGRAR